MIYALVVLGVLAGVGLGFFLGVLFARSDQGKVFDLMTSTVDRLTTSALFPGLKGVVPAVEVEETEEMFNDLGVDESSIPAYLREERDPTEAPVG